jgi:hypothetical protein
MDFYYCSPTIAAFFLVRNKVARHLFTEMVNGSFSFTTEAVHKYRAAHKEIKP